jgi:hypothetical protein
VVKDNLPYTSGFYFKTNYPLSSSSNLNHSEVSELGERSTLLSAQATHVNNTGSRLGVHKIKKLTSSHFFASR